MLNHMVIISLTRTCQIACPDARGYYVFMLGRDLSTPAYRSLLQVSQPTIEKLQSITTMKPTLY